MALSTRKKNIIIADWKTGNYKQKDMLLKHKIDRKTLMKVIEGILPTNAQAVEVLHNAKMVENSLKNPHELKAVQNVVDNRLKVENMTSKVLDKLDGLLDKGKAHKVITEGQGMGASSGTVIEYPMQVEHYEKAMNTIDKASLTLKVNERFNSSPTTQIQNANINQGKPEIEGYSVETIET